MTAFPLYSPISSNTPKGNRAISTTKTKPNRCTHRYTHYHSLVYIAVEQALYQLVHWHPTSTNEHKCLSALEKPTSCGGTGRRAAPRPTPIPNPAIAWAPCLSPPAIAAWLSPYQGHGIPGLLSLTLGIGVGRSICSPRWLHLSACHRGQIGPDDRFPRKYQTST